MGSYNRDDNRSGGYRGGGFSRGGGSRGGFGGGRPSFGGARGGDREMFSTICSNCGKECQVPFKPTNGKPVYCSDCFEKMGNRSDRPSNDRPRFEDRSPRAPQAQSGPDLGAINAKLDRILSILEPKVVVPVVVQVPVVKTAKLADKVDLPKIKKAVKKAASTKKK